jgi:glycolate oxidase
MQPIPRIVTQLRQAVGAENVLSAHSEMLVYECDGFTIEKNSPDVVVFPRNTADVVEVVKICNAIGVPFLPRGAGTSLAGGCLPIGGGVMIVLTRMKQILEINLRDRYAVVEPGVVNVWLTNALKGTGYHYAPDPSSQGACTIGGNVATNSGGPHTLKYGVTVNHVLGVEAVMADGSSTPLSEIAWSQVGHVPGFNFVSIEREFSGLLDGRRVDMVTPKFLNCRIRDQVLSSAEPLYVAA